MKQTKLHKFITLGFFIIILLTSCAQKEDVQIFEPVEEKPTDMKPDEEATTATKVLPPFLIQAEENLKPAITALYEAYLEGESPVFVDAGADLIAKTRISFSDHPAVEPTFLWGRVLLSQSDLPVVNEFIEFAISIEGQQVLDDAGLLVLAEGLTDQAGVDVQFTQPLRRVISTYGPSTAYIYAVHAADRLVSASYLGARDPFGSAIMGKIDPRFPALMGDDYFNQDDFNVEQAAILEPDLVITSARTGWIDTVKALDIPVFLYDAETPERLKEAMLSTGLMFGPNSNAYAEAWVAYYDAVVHKIQRTTVDIPEEDRVRVLFTGTSPLRVASGEMYQDFIINAAGGVSVSSTLTGYWNDVNIEQVAIWDPEVIIVPPYGGATVEAITESPEWQILDAVKEGRVYLMPKLVPPWDTPTPDSVLGIVWMAELLYPDLIDLDCAEETQYFYKTFYDYQITAEELDTVCKIND